MTEKIEEIAGACSATSPGDGRDSPILNHGTRPWHDLDAMPGEFKMLWLETGEGRNLGFGVKRVVPSSDDENHGQPYYTASTPYRACVTTGNTPEEAVSSLLFCFTELARNGSFNPKYPSEHGDPPVQHAINILTERLLWQVERRHEHLGRADADIVWAERNADEKAEKERQEMYLSFVARDNEIISALGTSIAALARVKDL
jgi:hypothetical protein